MLPETELMRVIAACFRTVGGGNIEIHPARGPNGEHLGQMVQFGPHNMGFFVGDKGLFWTYFSGDCQCQKEGNTYYLVPRNAAEAPNIGTTKAVFRRHGTGSNLAVGVSKRPPAAFLKLASDRPKAGARVYAIGERDYQFVVTQGHVVSFELKGDVPAYPIQIRCELQVYHGFCGGPLLSEEGFLVGFGATLGEPRVEEKSFRGFKTGLFDCAQDLWRMQEGILSKSVFSTYAMS